MTTRQLHLNLFIFDTGHHESAWRLPESNANTNIELAAYQYMAQRAEQAKFDSIFLADSPAIVGSPARRPAARLDPSVLLAALAASTQRIGLIGTASTTYNDPYNLARRFSSLDHISSGRAGWNIVTTSSADAARNFGLDGQPEHADRYARAEEFLRVATALWESWDDDAVIIDKARGVHAVAEKVRPIRHRGQHFQVEGALTLSRSPQVHPVLVQAGSSEGGKAFAARWAQAVFTAQTSLEEAQAFYRELKAKAQAVGRDPNYIKILPGIVPILADTVAQAQELEAELDRLISAEHAVSQLANVLGVEPDRLQLDKPLPNDLPDESEIQGARSRRNLVVSLAREKNLTVRELIRQLGGGRGHWTFVGTPVQAADAIEHYFHHGAADGFNIMPAVLPSGLDYFVDKVVPILQERKLFRREYAGTTLREHYGLAVPG